MSRVSFSDGFQFGAEVDDLIKRDKNEFYKRKMIKISNVTSSILTISTKELLQKLEAILPNTKIESIEINGNIGYITLKDPLQSYRIIKSYSTVTIDTETYNISYMTPDAMLFFGNLPLSYQTRELAKLAASYGVINRCMVIHSKISRKSKGYGFVEYSNRNNAMQAKLHLGAKYLEGRSLRVDWSDERMREYEDTHATTLFVDKLPRHFLQDGVLNAIFQKHGKVIFCQIATSSSTGISRGFAFVDMANAIDAESALNACNNSIIDGTQVRVSYAMPGRPGASILHPKRPDSVGNLLTSFGMTQLPVLNFAQLLAAHGAPLMPAQLTALMAALQNYNDSSSSTAVRISSSCDSGHHCIMSGQDSHSPTLHTNTMHSIQINDNNNNNNSNMLPQFIQTLEDTNDEYSSDIEYPLVYQHDAKYYSSTDIQEYPYQALEDNIIPTDENTQIYQTNDWSTSQQFPMKALYEDNCYLQEPDNKSYYLYANEDYAYGDAAVSQPIQTKTSVNSNLQTATPPNVFLNKKTPPINAKSYNIWGQHDQGLIPLDIFKRISISTSIQE